MSRTRNAHASLSISLLDHVLRQPTQLSYCDISLSFSVFVDIKSSYVNLNKGNSDGKQRKKKHFLIPSSRATPFPPHPGGRHLTFEKKLVNSPLCRQFRRSNNPPVKASQTVKFPTPFSIRILKTKGSQKKNIKHRCLISRPVI